MSIRRILLRAERMPFQLHRPGTGTPAVLSESDVRRILDRNMPDPRMQETAWRRLNQGERVFIKGGFLHLGPGSRVIPCSAWQPVTNALPAPCLSDDTCFSRV